MIKNLNPFAAPKPGQAKIDWLTGRLSWRVTSSVFMTIVVVQAMILFFTAKNFENQQLNQLAESGKSAIAPILSQQRMNSGAMLDPEALDRVLGTTLVRGIAIYQPGRTIADEVYGEPSTLLPDRANAQLRISWFSEDKKRFEVSFGPNELKMPRVVVVRLAAEHIPGRVWDYVMQMMVISFLLSAFITTVLILVLGKWMIEPILMLRNNLLGAAKNPTEPKKYLTIYTRRDELGSVISSANKLIKLNAENLERLNQQAQDKIFRVAFFDALTELPNRPYFLNKIDEIVSVQDSALQRYPQVGVLVVDIDHFGDVNDTLGYEAGDELLRQVSQRLKETLPDAIMIARLSEDEFAAILDLPLEADDVIQKIADGVLGIFERTFDIFGNELILEASAGLAIWPRDADRGSELLKKAETALDQAKLEDKGHFRIYSQSYELEVQKRIQMARDLRIAIEEKQFTLVYQPQFDAKTRAMIGAEALLRWERPDPETGKKAFVRPDHFIPIAEQTGLIVPIGRWVLETAARFAKQCQEEGIAPFRVAVNLSGVQFHRDDVVSLTRDVLAKTRLNARYLELEVTESAVMKDIDQTIALLTQLKNLGVDLAIDDFGTGYSSLSYLKRFPVHRLKVDRSFIMNATTNAGDASIAKTIIQLGHAIGLKVIAEGVETIGQVEFLEDHGCDEFQGYFFSKPLPEGEFRGFARGYVGSKKTG